MKISAFVLALCLSFVKEANSAWTEEERSIEAEQVALWENNLREAQAKSVSERIPLLWLGLRNMGYRSGFEGRSSAVDQIFGKLQKEILSIPGHAQYFVDELERLRKQNPKMDHGRERSLYIAHTLIHMPSPETIRVLGNYLYDERDIPPERNWTPENAHLAAYALSRIGVRSFPIEGPLVPYRLTIWPDLKQLPDYRAWWEEIKSGQRTFSFKGQAVEYRFKSDGTWDTIPITNSPDDGLKPLTVATTEGPVKTSKVKHEHPPESSFGTVWWWYVIGVFALLVLGSWFWRNQFGHK